MLWKSNRANLSSIRRTSSVSSGEHSAICAKQEVSDADEES
jgi:hypothetical protein